MKKFSIKDLEHLSGIKAHTLRVWEHRYNFIKPQRTGANFRYYTVAELKQLLGLNLLNRNGHKISQLATLPSDEIESRINLLSSDEDRKQRVLNDLLIGMYSLDTAGFEQGLDNAFEGWTIQEAMEDIIFVFLKKIGLLWSGNRLTEEHFVVTSIRKKMMAAINITVPAMRKDRTVLLFLPEGRQLDLGLLYSHYLLKHHGLRVLDMGSDVSVSNLKAVFTRIKPDYIFTYLPERSRFRVEDLLPIVEDEAPQAKLIVATYAHPYPKITAHQQLITMDYDQALDYMMA